MTTVEWDAVTDQYGPHQGLAIYDPLDTSRSWDDIELVQVQTRYRDLSEEVDASALAPNYQRTEARFVEGQVHHDAIENVVAAGQNGDPGISVDALEVGHVLALIAAGGDWLRVYDATAVFLDGFVRSTLVGECCHVFFQLVISRIFMSSVSVVEVVPWLLGAHVPVHEGREDRGDDLGVRREAVIRRVAL